MNGRCGCRTYYRLRLGPNGYKASKKKKSSLLRDALIRFFSYIFMESLLMDHLFAVKEAKMGVFCGLSGAAIVSAQITH